jgi:hypothetical protein
MENSEFKQVALIASTPARQHASTSPSASLLCGVLAGQGQVTGVSSSQTRSLNVNVTYGVRHAAFHDASLLLHSSFSLSPHVTKLSLLIYWTACLTCSCQEKAENEQIR